MTHAKLSAAALAAMITLAGWSEASAAQADKVAANPPEARTNQASAEKPLAIAVADPALQWAPCPPGMPKGCGIAVLHGNPATPNADIFLRVPGGSAIPPHSHSSAERMILVQGNLDVQYQGAAKASLKATDYAYGPARLPHRADCRSAEPCILFIAFEGPVDLIPFEGALAPAN